MSMVFTLFILIILLFLIFSYSMHKRQCTTTASLLRDVWSGADNGYGLMCFTNNSGGVCRSPIANIDTIFMIPERPCVCGTCLCHHLQNVIDHLRYAYSSIAQIVSEIMANALLAVTDIAENMSGAMNCHSSCRFPRQIELASSPFYTPGLVSREYSNKDMKRLGSVDDRAALTKDANTEGMKKSSDSDKISDYEVVFDRPPPPPFNKPLQRTSLALPSIKLSEQEKPPPPSNKQPSPDRDTPVHPKPDKPPSQENPAVSPKLSPEADKMSSYPFENKEKEVFATTSSVAEPGSSKRKPDPSPPASDVEIKSCRKCLEKGRTCISDCPKAKEWDGSPSDLVPKVERIEVMPPDTDVSVTLEPRRCRKCVEEKDCTSSRCPLNKRSNVSIRRKKSSSSSISLRDLVEDEAWDFPQKSNRRISFSRHSEDILSQQKYPVIPFKDCPRCEKGVMCDACSRPTLPHISFNEAAQRSVDLCGQKPGHETGRSSFSAAYRRRSTNQRDTIATDTQTNGQLNNCTSWEENKTKPNSKQDNKIKSNDELDEALTGLLTREIASTSTANDKNSVGSIICPKCEKLGGKCVNHFTAV